MIALVALGGFVGANLRYAVSFVVTGLGGTLLANALGSVLLGVVLYEARAIGVLSPRARTLLATGILASFTTYSTFALETLQAEPRWLVLNLLAHYALGFLGIIAGRTLVRSLSRRWP